MKGGRFMKRKVYDKQFKIGAKFVEKILAKKK